MACRPGARRSTASRSRTSTTRDCAGARRSGRSARRRAAGATCRSSWSGDLAGQGWGINPDLGGYRIFSAIAGARARLLPLQRGHVYADGPLAVDRPAARRAARGATSSPRRRQGRRDARRVPRPVRLQPARRQPARLRRRASRRSTSGTTTRSATTGSPVRSLTDDALHRARRRRARRARQAGVLRVAADRAPAGRRGAGASTAGSRTGRMLDVFVLDMRTYKDPNDDNRYADPQRGLLGARAARVAQARARRLHARPGRCIANDLPLGLVVPDGAALEGVAQGDAGAPLGRELEFADVLSFAHRRGIDGIVFLTADVHYTAAHHYDPARAAFADFTPFWEFVVRPAQRRRVRAQRARRAPSARRRCSSSRAAARRTPRPPTASSSSVTSRSTAPRGS